MNWPAWQPTYEAILADFGWDTGADHASAQALQQLVPKGTWKHVGTELKHRPLATIVGCGPALEAATANQMQGIVVAADGACERLLELHVVPRVVVTDLDGDPESLVWAAERGASMVVHAHGHNQDALQMVPELGPLVAGSCQSNPAGLEPLRNHGGFTDGDRAVLLCQHYDVKRIQLLGFDTTAAPSKYSHQFDPALKARKLAWAQRILDEASRRTTIVW